MPSCRNPNAKLVRGTLRYALLARSRQAHSWRVLGPTMLEPCAGDLGPIICYIYYNILYYCGLKFPGSPFVWDLKTVRTATKPYRPLIVFGTYRLLVGANVLRSLWMPLVHDLGCKQLYLMMCAFRQCPNTGPHYVVDC